MRDPASVFSKIKLQTSLGVLLVPETSSLIHAPQPITLAGAPISTLTLKTLFLANAT